MQRASRSSTAEAQQTELTARSDEMVPAAQRQHTHSTNSLCGITQLGSFLTELINDDKQGALKIIFLDGKKNP